MNRALEILAYKLAEAEANLALAKARLEETQARLEEAQAELYKLKEVQDVQTDV